MKPLTIATILSSAVWGQSTAPTVWDEVSDGMKLDTVIAMNSVPPVKTVNIAPPGVSSKQRYWWYSSQIALAGANFLDAHSSWGKYELNPVLRGGDGRFGTKSVLIKSAIVGGMVAYQHIVYRKILKRDEDKRRFLKMATIANYCLTGVFTGVAIHNYQIPSPTDAAIRRLIVIQ